MAWVKSSTPTRPQPSSYEVIDSSLARGRSSPMVHVSLFLVVLALTQTSVAQERGTPQKRPRPTQSVASLAGKSNFIFRGTVKKLRGTTLDVFPATARTAIVHVAEILDGSQTSGDSVDQDITVELLQAQSVKEGQEAVFFSNVVAYGKSIAVQEVGHLDAKEFTGQAREQVARVVQARPERELQKRIAQADLVVTGKVVSYKPVAGGEGLLPSSEHDPQWWQVEIQVESIEKGKAPGEKVVVYIPHSDDIRWFLAPKITVGQEGIFLLHRTPIAELKIE